MSLEKKTWFTGVLGLTIVCSGCSDGGPAAGDQGAGGTGGGSATGGTDTGGRTVTGGSTATGGSPSGGTDAGGGSMATGGSPSGGAGTGGTNVNTGGSVGGVGTGGMNTGGAADGGSGAGGAATGGSGGSTGGAPATCDPSADPVTPSENTGRNASGTGPYEVVIETNSDPGIRCGTIYRPEDLDGEEKFPIFVWGEGGCSQNGLSNQAAMAEIASWGYFIIADGTPDGTNACSGGQSGDALLDYVTWAIAQNDEPCSDYYRSIEPTKVAADGFSCGGLMAENVSDDPRFTAIGITSSGLMAPNSELYNGIHTPFKIMNGGPSDVAYENGLRDYEEISALGKPIIYFSKTSAGHGGDLGQGRGDFNLVNLAWLNWQLKGDEGSTGKGFLIGDTCEFCMDSGWDFRSANIE